MCVWMYLVYIFKKYNKHIANNITPYVFCLQTNGSPIQKKNVLFANLFIFFFKNGYQRKFVIVNAHRYNKSIVGLNECSSQMKRNMLWEVHKFERFCFSNVWNTRFSPFQLFGLELNHVLKITTLIWNSLRRETKKGPAKSSSKQNYTQTHYYIEYI